jgi:hypothetical protein
MTGGVMMTSDDLGEVPPERLRWWRLFLTERRAACRFPLLGQPTPESEAHRPDPVLVQVRDLAQGGRSAVFVFNTGDEPVEREFALATLGIAGPRFVHNWLEGRTWPEAVTVLPVRLQPHDGVLLLVGDRPWLESPEPLG